MPKLAQKIIAQNKKTKDKTLDLGNCGLTKLPEELLDCVWVETLILSGQWWVYDLEKKGEIWHSSQNKGEKNQITALLPDLSRLSNLRVLVLNNNPIQDLSPIAGLVQLQQLDCSFTQVSDLSPVAGLVQLQLLYCHSTPVNDLSPVAGLVQLQLLSCSSTPVSDLSPIAVWSSCNNLTATTRQLATCRR
jgi:internalin A